MNICLFNVTVMNIRKRFKAYQIQRNDIIFNSWFSYYKNILLLIFLLNKYIAAQKLKHTKNEKDCLYFSRINVHPCTYQV